MSWQNIFLDSITLARGCPVCVYTDPGTKNGLVAAIQCYLRAEGPDEYATWYPGSLPTPGTSRKTLVGAGHVNPQILGVN